MITKPSCLIIDDEPDLSEFIAMNLEKMGIKTDCTETVADAKHMLAHRRYDFCLTDMRLPDGNGLDLVKHIGFQHAGLPIAIITAFANSDNAVAALKAGAFDYLSKPIALPQLQALAKAAIKFGQSYEQKNTQVSLLGNSKRMNEVRRQLEKISRNQASLLITGELGTGKESAARLIHLNSSRHEHPFIKVNCATLHTESAEKAFFGQAHPNEISKEKEGFLQAAKAGTLFLDNVEKLPNRLQHQLLDFMQEEDFETHVISATHQDLNALMAQGLFNKDFYYYLNVMHLQMPALREIPEDIALIAQHLLIQIAGNYGNENATLSECALAKLKTCQFLGNVRELRNTLERAVTLCESHIIKAEDLLTKETVALPDELKLDITKLPLPDYLEKVEKQAILEALTKTRQNKTAAAKLLGVSFRTLRYRLSKLGLSKENSPNASEDELT